MTRCVIESATVADGKRVKKGDMVSYRGQYYTVENLLQVFDGAHGTRSKILGKDVTGNPVELSAKYCWKEKKVELVKMKW